MLFRAAGENPLIPIFLCFIWALYPSLKIRQQAAEKRERLQDSLPLLFSCLSLSLDSARSLDHALAAAEKAFRRDPLWSPELQHINRRLRNRESPEKVLNELAEKLDFPEAGMYLNLLYRVSISGSRRDLMMLDMQNLHFAHVLKDKQRKRLASRSNRYLLPMVMNLLAVMLISFAPLIPSLRFS